MSKPFDAATKRLVEAHPADWLEYLGLTVGETTFMETDLTTVASDADKILRVDAPTPYFAHIEFQSTYKNMDERVLLYNVLVFCRHRLPVQSVVVLLRREADGPNVSGRGGYVAPDGGFVDFGYSVVRAWETPREEALSGGLATLPLAPLSDEAQDDLPSVIHRMEDRIRNEASSDEAGMLWTTTFLLMGLKFEREFIIGLLKGVRGMEESTTYQYILEIGEERGMAKGIEKGIEKGMAKGEEKGKAKEALSLLLRLGGKRFGPPDAKTQETLAATESLERLEQLAERLLEVENWNELLA